MAGCSSSTKTLPADKSSPRTNPPASSPPSRTAAFPLTRTSRWIVRATWLWEKTTIGNAFGSPGSAASPLPITRQEEAKKRRTIGEGVGATARRAAVYSQPEHPPRATSHSGPRRMPFPQQGLQLLFGGPLAGKLVHQLALTQGAHLRFPCFLPKLVIRWPPPLPAFGPFPRLRFLEALRNLRDQPRAFLVGNAGSTGKTIPDAGDASPTFETVPDGEPHRSSRHHDDGTPESDPDKKIQHGSQPSGPSRQSQRRGAVAASHRAAVPFPSAAPTLTAIRTGKVGQGPCVLVTTGISPRVRLSRRADFGKTPECTIIISREPLIFPDIAMDMARFRAGFFLELHNNDY